MFGEFLKNCQINKGLAGIIFGIERKKTNRLIVIMTSQNIVMVCVRIKRPNSMETFWI